MQTAGMIVTIAEWWGVIGFLIAIPFLTFGIDRIDENARGAYVFRPLLVPAVVLIWPVVLWRWWLLETGRDAWPLRHRPPRASHKWAALAFAVLIPLTIIIGLAVKQTWPADIAPLLLEAPE